VFEANPAQKDDRVALLKGSKSPKKEKVDKMLGKRKVNERLPRVRNEKPKSRTRKHGKSMKIWGHGPKKTSRGCVFCKSGKGWEVHKKTYDFDGVDGSRSTNQGAPDGVLRRKQAQSRKSEATVLGR
jgi:hypothetical protein